MADELQHSGEDGPDEVTFVGFIISLVHTAAHHLGDVADPDSGQRSEVNLPAAHQIIEILGLLDEKTKGNLSAEERQLLEQALYELRLRFVEIAKTASQVPEPSRIIIP
jgi:hypothetical protein